MKRSSSPNIHSKSEKIVKLDITSPLDTIVHKLDNEPIKLLLGEEYIVKLVLIDSPIKFYCQVSFFFENFKYLNDDMQDYYSTLSDKVPKKVDLKQGDYIAASENDHWYRSRIESISRANLKIFCVDYGNYYHVPISLTSWLVKRFSLLPEQAIPCSIKGLSLWPSEFNPNNYLGQDIKCKFISYENGIFNVSMKDMNDQLIFPKIEFDIPKIPSITFEESLINSMVPVKLSHLPSPCCFYVQLINENFSSFENELQIFYSKDPGQSLTLTTNHLIKGAIISCLYTDGRWYRARIDSRILNEKNEFMIFFIDYGNTYISTTDKMRILSDQFVLFNAQAICCSLKGITKWPSNFEVEHISTYKICQFIELNEGKYFVNLFDNGKKPLFDYDDNLVLKPKIEPVEPKLGSTVRVMLTDLTSPKSFYCQLSPCSEYLRLEDEMQEFYDKLNENEEINYNIAKVKKGSYCVSRSIEDDKWYRAKFLSDYDAEEFPLFSIDYGNTEVCTKNRLKILAEQFMTVNAQAIHCCINEIDNWPQDFIEENIFRVVLAQFIVKSYDKYIVRLLDLKRKIPILKMSSDTCENELRAIKTCSQRSLKLIEVPLNNKVEVMLCELGSPSRFYVNLCRFENDYSSLLKKLNLFYNSASSNDYLLSSVSLSIGDLVVCKHKDLWCRAEIINLNSDSADILLIDSGYYKKEFYERLRRISNEFCTLNSQAIPCYIENMKEWPSEFAASKIMTKVLCEFICKENEIMKVNLFSINNEKLFTTIKQTNCLGIDLTTNLEVEIPEKNKKLSVTITEIGSPKQFYIRIALPGNPFKTLEDKMKDYYNKLTKSSEASLDLDKVKIGQIVMCRHTNEHWRRAQIISKSDELIKVFYVDYGNIDKINLKNVKMPKEEFLLLKMQAIKCFAQGLNYWPEEFYSLKDLKCEFLKYKNGIWTVNIYSNSNSLLICDQNEPKLRTKLNVVPTVLSSPASFYVRIHQNYDYDDLEEQMQDFYNSLKVNELIPNKDELQVGSIFACNFADDGRWYRAKILSIENDLFNVFYIDYGNIEKSTCEKFRILTEKFNKFKSFLIKCHIDGQDNWKSGFVDDYLYTIVSCVFIGRDAQKNSYSVKLYEPEGTSIVHDWLYEMIPEVGLILNVKICEMTTPEKFFCQLEFDLDEWRKMMNEMQDFYSQELENLKISSPQIGDVVAAIFNEDDCWYRAEIIDVKDQKVKVKYVDYGNEAWINNNDIRKLHSKYYIFRKQAVACSLKGHKNWPKSFCEQYLYESIMCEFLSCNEIFIVNLYGEKEELISYIENDDIINNQPNEDLKLDVQNCSFKAHESFPEESFHEEKMKISEPSSIHSEYVNNRTMSCQSREMTGIMNHIDLSQIENEISESHLKIPFNGKTEGIDSIKAKRNLDNCSGSMNSIKPNEIENDENKRFLQEISCIGDFEKKCLKHSKTKELDLNIEESNEEIAMNNKTFNDLTSNKEQFDFQSSQETSSLNDLINEMLDKVESI